MKLNYIYELLLFVVLILLQVTVFNQISVFGLATPFLYIYFLLKLPVGRNVFYVIIMGFLMGFIIDIFLNTPGVNAAATTLIAAFRQPILHLFYDKKEAGNFIPGIHANYGPFIRFSFLAVAIHQTALHGLEAFTLFNPHILLLRWLASITLTLVIIFALDSFTYKKLASDE
ncbi:MAG: rod shape-determining protein MreD [Dysgonamonadaceae bacterium]|nr:rod shape-determining protein MreD [Dysgonamonadaceae bacterium]MDD4728288.1 rod shape-determining protein MreD [Dysgonamonadaceae bacterium]